MDLILNPRVRIRCDGATAWIQTPDPELGLQTYEVSQHSDRALFDTIRSILTAAPAADDTALDARTNSSNEVELDDAIWQRLGEMGIVVPASDAAPDLTFACDLPRARIDQPAARRAHTVHASLAVQRGPELPGAVAALLGGASLPLTQQFPIAWVTDPITGIAAPYAATGRHAAALDGLRAGQPAPDDLPDDVRADFAAAEILVDGEVAARRQADWDHRLRDAQRSYAERGWAIVRGLLPTAQLPALQRYVRSYVAQGYARRGDRHVALRWSAHNQHLVTLIHAGLHRMVSRVTGCATKPSYSFLASYMPGAVLSRHRDRAQCKYSVSLQLDAEPHGRAPWPLYLEDLRGQLAVGWLEPGDAVFYQGCELAHWRDELPAGQTSTSAFLHYVDHDFTGDLS
jgi:hypothetical protein